MQETKKLQGITVNGIPLDSYLGEIKNERIEAEVMAIVRASKCQHIYHPVRKKIIKTKEERNGPVMSIPHEEIHHKNRENYIRRVMKKDDVRGAIIAVLLSAEKPLSAFEIKNIINEPIASDPVKGAQVRVHIGIIMKSKLSEVISKEFTDGRSRGAKYYMSLDGKRKYTLDLAIDAANQKIKERTESLRGPINPPKEKKKPIFDFVLTDKNELPVLQVEVMGKIDININFNFSRG
jgi:hypothetical protein